MRFVPDRIFLKINEITIDILKKEKVKGLVLDIDNTLAPRYVPLPDEDIKNFVLGLKYEGIKIYIISNNRMNRVSKFAKALDLPFIYSGMKPFPRAFSRAVREMGLEKNSVVAVGDQIYTDVFGAHTAGIRAWLVSPVDPRETIIFRLRRILEKPFISRYYQDEGKKKE